VLVEMRDLLVCQLEFEPVRSTARKAAEEPTERLGLVAQILQCCTQRSFAREKIVTHVLTTKLGGLQARDSYCAQYAVEASAFRVNFGCTDGNVNENLGENPNWLTINNGK